MENGEVKFVLLPAVTRRVRYLRVRIRVFAATDQRNDVVNVEIIGRDRLLANATNAVVALINHRRVYVLNKLRDLTRTSR